MTSDTNDLDRRDFMLLATVGAGSMLLQSSGSGEREEEHRMMHLGSARSLSRPRRMGPRQ